MYHNFICFFRKDLFKKVVRVFSNDSSEWLEEYKKSKMLIYSLDNKFLEKRYSLLALEYLKQYLSRKGLFKAQKEVEDNLEESTNLDVFSFTEQRINF